MQIHERMRHGGSNAEGMPLGLVNWMVDNRKDTHVEYLCMCPTTHDVYDVLISVELDGFGTLHVTQEHGEC